MKKYLENLLYLLRYTWVKCKAIYFSTFLKYGFSACLPLINIVGLGAVVSALETHGDVKRVILWYAAFNLGVGLITELFTYIDNIVMRRSSNVIQFDYITDAADVDYYYAQNGSIRDLKQKSMRCHPAWLMGHVGTMVKHIIQFVGVTYIFAQLSPLYIFVMGGLAAATVALSFRSQKQEFDFQNEKTADDRRSGYLFSCLTHYMCAKEVRVNRANAFIKEKYREVTHRQLARLDSFLQKRLHIGIAETALSVAQTASLYFYFSFRLYEGKISVAEYSVLIGATSLFFGVVVGFFDTTAKMKNTLKYTDIFRKYNEYVRQHSGIKRGTYEEAEEIRVESIRFEDVSFRYPESGKDTLKHLNFEITKNQKVGIVGLNGAGKTTLIHLLLRLYDPTEGRILINGTDIRTIPYEKYSQYFGTVLQDYFLFAYPVWENVAFRSDYDPDRLKECIQKAGLSDKIGNLPGGVESIVNKDLDKSGIEFSGGEAQKLALARALYKNAQILILDEPTSAMDPMAEYDFFTKLSENTESRTAVFISHRLSSTIFCDTILVLENGEIVERGDHAELMKIHGVYQSLFSAQARHFTKGRDEN